MKYAVLAVCDQTFTYLTDDGDWTTKHSEAQLFDTKEEAEQASVHTKADAIEDVADEAEFREREATW